MHTPVYAVVRCMLMLAMLSWGAAFMPSQSWAGFVPTLKLEQEGGNTTTSVSGKADVKVADNQKNSEVVHATPSKPEKSDSSV